MLGFDSERKLMSILQALADGELDPAEEAMVFGELADGRHVVVLDSQLAAGGYSEEGDTGVIRRPDHPDGDIVRILSRLEELAKQVGASGNRACLEYLGVWLGRCPQSSFGRKVV